MRQSAEAATSAAHHQAIMFEYKPVAIKNYLEERKCRQIDMRFSTSADELVTAIRAWPRDRIRSPADTIEIQKVFGCTLETVPCIAIEVRFPRIDFSELLCLGYLRLWLEAQLH